MGNTILPGTGRGTAAEGGGGGAAASRDSLASGPRHQPAAGPPPRSGEEFAACALRLAGSAGILFGWTPETFWNATPAELLALVEVLRGEEAAPPDAAMLAQLMELFPDG